ncbi:ABC transporter permease [Peptoniphilus sp. GNH]|nr:ABC transporter permease [Peptoniphilus sp. GNH]
MKKLKNLIDTHISFITILLIIIIWQVAGNLHLLPKYIIPTPLEIIQAFYKNFDNLLFHSKITIIEAIIGLFYGIIIGCFLAIIMDNFQVLNKAIYPLLIITQTIPTIAIAPILVLWLGYGMAPKIVLIILTTTFPIVISILDGFKNADQDAICLLRLMNASKMQIMWHIKIPNALSYFYAGLRVSVSYAFVAAVVSEWLGSFEGLGVYMIRSKKLFQYDTMFAIIILISVISLASMELVKISERKFLKWKYIGEKK